MSFAKTDPPRLLSELRRTRTGFAVAMLIIIVALVVLPLWDRETDTVYSKDFGKLGREYAKALVKQLRKDKLIGNK
jgi:hypothetical protein